MSNNPVIVKNKSVTYLVSAEELMLLNCGVGEDSWESLGLQGDKSVLNIHWKDWCWSWNYNTLWPPDAKSWLTGKDPDAGKDWRQEEKGMTEDEMDRWHHWLDGCEFKQSLGAGDGQGSLVCCNLWGRRVRHNSVTELNWTDGLPGNYSQYPVINHNGKEYKKECMCMLNWIPLLYSGN